MLHKSYQSASFVASVMLYSFHLFSTTQPLHIDSEKVQNDVAYLSWLAKSYIINRKARTDWKSYLKIETSSE